VYLSSNPGATKIMKEEEEERVQETRHCVAPFIFRIQSKVSEPQHSLGTVAALGEDEGQGETRRFHGLISSCGDCAQAPTRESHSSDLYGWHTFPCACSIKCHQKLLLLYSQAMAFHNISGSFLTDVFPWECTYFFMERKKNALPPETAVLKSGPGVSP
jgi:hypothetical protein